MILSHRIALDPTYAQQAYFRRACGVSRFAYNWALAEWKRAYDAGEKPTKLKSVNCEFHRERPRSQRK
jgi:putative transposase